MTRGVFGEKIGLSSGYIKAVERRKSKPSPDAVRKIALALDLPFEKIYKEYRPNEPVPDPNKIPARKQHKRRREKGSRELAVASQEIATMPAVSPLVLPPGTSADPLDVLWHACRAAQEKAMTARIQSQAGVNVADTRQAIRDTLKHISEAFQAALEWGALRDPPA